MKHRNMLVAITLLNAGVAAGFAITGLVSPVLIIGAGTGYNAPAHTFALYAAVRAVSLALLVLFFSFKKYDTGLIALALLAAMIQLGDALIGMYLHDAGKTIGPFVLALATFWAVWRTGGYSALRSGT